MLAAVALAVTLGQTHPATAQQRQIEGLPWLQQQPPAQTSPGAPGAGQPAPPPSSPPPTGSLEGGKAPLSPATGEISGSAQVLDTANLIVAGYAVTLFGIVGMGHPYDRQMASYLAAQGGTIRCVPHANKYICMTTSGFDVAEAALFNGGARAGTDAPSEYLRQQDLARAAHRGIWAPRQPGTGAAALFKGDGLKRYFIGPAGGKEPDWT